MQPELGTHALPGPHTGLGNGRSFKRVRTWGTLREGDLSVAARGERKGEAALSPVRKLAHLVSGQGIPEGYGDRAFFGLKSF